MAVEQRISVAQLNELTDEQKERLREWWEPQDYDVVTDGTSCYVVECDLGGMMYLISDSEGLCPPFGKDGLLPLLSIGQCLELLEQLSNDGFYAIDRRTDKNGSREYAVIMDMFKSADKELIITLWQAVKAVL